MTMNKWNENQTNKANLLSKLKRNLASLELVLTLQKLFSQMILSWQKYVNPYSVLKAITDIQGNPIKIGKQEDITEFNQNFLSRLEEGL